jgi:hypothetical protein
MASAYLSARSRGIAPLITAKPSRIKSSLKSPYVGSVPSTLTGPETFSVAAAGCSVIVVVVVDILNKSIDVVCLRTATEVEYSYSNSRLLLVVAKLVSIRTEQVMRPPEPGMPTRAEHAHLFRLQSTRPQPLPLFAGCGDNDLSGRRFHGLEKDARMPWSEDLEFRSARHAFWTQL